MRSRRRRSCRDDTAAPTNRAMMTPYYSQKRPSRFPTAQSSRRRDSIHSYSSPPPPWRTRMILLSSSSSQRKQTTTKRLPRPQRSCCCFRPLTFYSSSSSFSRKSSMSSALDFLSATLSSSLGLLSKRQTERKNNHPRRNLQELLARWPFLSRSRVFQRRHHLNQLSFLRRRWAFLLLLLLLLPSSSSSSSSSSCSSSFLNPGLKTRRFPLVNLASNFRIFIAQSLDTSPWFLPNKSRIIGSTTDSGGGGGGGGWSIFEDINSPVFVRVFLLRLLLFVNEWFYEGVRARAREFCEKKNSKKFSLVVNGKVGDRGTRTPVVWTSALILLRCG